MRIIPLLFLCTSLAFAACASQSGVAEGPPAGAPPAKPAEAQKTEAEKKTEQDKKVEERAAKEKELRNKKRDLDYARVALETAAIDRHVRTMTVENALVRTRLDLEKAQKDLRVFREEHKPRELDEHKITLDAQTYRAEEAKDEQAELESMYKEDEFAKKTKELVLKRGRRQME